MSLRNSSERRVPSSEKGASLGVTGAAAICAMTIGAFGLAGMSGCESSDKTSAKAAGEAVTPMEATWKGSWRLVRMAGREVPADSGITLDLAEDGKASGSAGVNRFFGTHSSAGPGALAFSQMGTTRMAGPPERMQRETEFLGAMGRITAYRLKGDTLEMGDIRETLLVWKR